MAVARCLSIATRCYAEHVKVLINAGCGCTAWGSSHGIEIVIFIVIIVVVHASRWRPATRLALSGWGRTTSHVHLLFSLSQLNFSLSNSQLAFAQNQIGRRDASSYRTSNFTIRATGAILKAAI